MSRKVLLIICLILLVFGIVLPVTGYEVVSKRYQQDFALAHTAATELEGGISLLRTLPQNPFDAKTVSAAQRDFGQALTTFSQLNGDVNLVPDVLSAAPVAGSRLQAAKHLLPLALDAARAGLAGCTIINTLAARFHNPLKKASGLTMADLNVVNQHIQVVKQSLDQAVGLVEQLQPEDLQLEPGLGKMIGEFRSYLPLIQQGVDQIASLAAALPALLGVGKPTSYLVEILDSTELRPGGGFIGNYGIATLAGGQVTSVNVRDTYLLDNASAKVRFIARPYGWFPLSYSTGWGLRDSNLDADFPTSARNGETLYHEEGGTVPLSGVFAITPALVEKVLTLTGPISVPEYHEKITASNLIDRIHYYQLIEESKGANGLSTDGNSPDRKLFTALLGQDVLARVRALPVSQLPKLFGLLADSLHTKDLQVYFNASSAEKTLQFYQVDDAVQSPPGDGIFVVDANVTPNKANQYLTTTVNDQVTIDSSGTAAHRTVISFAWTKSGLAASDFFGSTRYRGYIQVYLPAASALHTQAGWKGPFGHGASYGRAYWGGYFYLNYPLTGSITLTWSVAGAAQKVGHSWQYNYLIQHQAGAKDAVNLQVTLAQCATILPSSTGVIVTGKQQAHVAQVLNGDAKVNIDYTC